MSLFRRLVAAQLRAAEWLLWLQVRLMKQKSAGARALVLPIRLQLALAVELARVQESERRPESPAAAQLAAASGQA